MVHMHKQSTQAEVVDDQLHRYLQTKHPASRCASQQHDTPWQKWWSEALPLLSPKAVLDLAQSRAMLFDVLVYTWLGCSARETTNLLIFRTDSTGTTCLRSQMHNS